MGTSNKYDFKTVILGESNVGKTSILNRLVNERFSTYTTSTIGAAFNVWSSKKNNIKLCIWDTAGSERYDALLPLYYRDAAAAMVVFDVKDRWSFEKAKTYIERMIETNPRATILLVGNKIDTIENKTSPFQDEIDLYVSNSTIGLNYRLMSALSGLGVHEGFQEIAEAMSRRRTDLDDTVIADITDPFPNSKERRGCCIIS